MSTILELRRDSELIEGRIMSYEDGNTPRARVLEDYLRMMVRIRTFEDRCEELFRGGWIRGALHLCSGQEAVPVGVCGSLRSDDYLTFTYRSHGWSIARGLSLRAAFGEIFGRASGSSQGRGGSKHLGDWQRKMLPGTSVVAAGVPIATGIALATKLLGTGVVSVVVFGEGATGQGVFHEAMSQAALWRLPVVFICESNGYAELTPADHMNPLPEFGDRARAYGVRTIVCDGMDADEVSAAVAGALEHARGEEGPVFIEARTYRFCGHMTGDPQAYRHSDEVASWRTHDPLALLKERLLDLGVRESQITGILQAEEQAVIQAEREAFSDPEPAVDSIEVGLAPWMKGTR